MSYINRIPNMFRDIFENLTIKEDENTYEDPPPYTEKTNHNKTHFPLFPKNACINIQTQQESTIDNKSIEIEALKKQMTHIKLELNKAKEEILSLTQILIIKDEVIEELENTKAALKKCLHY